ncbi:hypothetical protein MTBLM5_280019 [Magnetospirillum sp. LM-5]|uniref:glycosyltransferase n=1 Tax=Magnetospirillum sp. LM-5 TaxID=2681466 RepID=UPI00137F54EA|nr:glycosyltransferase [Magnetospirillum sp. LM-5]CAA7618761.1 hypothetical protein MTBLM5_280019 [Magnetospirillum sp. LM-5]
MIRRICLLSFSPIPDDARVRRHGDALAAAGYQVTAIGLPGGRATPPAWAVHDITLPPPEGRLRPLYRALRLGAMAACRVVPALSRQIYWRQTLHQAMYRVASIRPADLVIANDWLTLPIAARLAADWKVPYVYDSHEFAIEEGADRPGWMMLVSPYVSAIEARHIARADAVVTVGDGIADLLQRNHCLKERPTVVRNTVPRALQPFRPCGTTIEVLYQGLLRDDRGLTALIDSVPLWRQEFSLRIRGPGDATVLHALKARAAASAAGPRIHFDPPVSPLEMVAAANSSDIGIHPIPTTSNQTRFCLPNKFFEYLQAGLALCVTDSAEMSTLLHRHDLGAVIAASTPDAIAAAVNSFDRNRVDACKKNALAAAESLCWESEQVRLTDAVDRVLKGE